MYFNNDQIIFIVDTNNLSHKYRLITSEPDTKKHVHIKVFFLDAVNLLVSIIHDKAINQIKPTALIII